MVSKYKNDKIKGEKKRLIRFPIRITVSVIFRVDSKVESEITREKMVA
jgi:hypothetical protein